MKKVKVNLGLLGPGFFTIMTSKFKCSFCGKLGEELELDSGEDGGFKLVLRCVKCNTKEPPKYIKEEGEKNDRIDKK